MFGSWKVRGGDGSRTTYTVSLEHECYSVSGVSSLHLRSGLGFSKIRRLLRFHVCLAKFRRLQERISKGFRWLVPKSKHA